MKKRLLILLFLISFLPMVCHSQPIIIGAESYLPLVNEPGQKQAGYVNVILDKALKNYNIQKFLVPYARATEMLKSGIIDILPITATIDFNDTSNVVFSTEDVGRSVMGYFVKLNSGWKYTETDSLEGVRLGFTHGVTYEALTTVKDKSGFQPLAGKNTNIRNIKKLLTGRITVLFEDINVIRYEAMRMGVSHMIKQGGARPVGCAIENSG